MCMERDRDYLLSTYSKPTVNQSQRLFEFLPATDIRVKAFPDDCTYDLFLIGNWRTAFQPEATSMQDFKVDEQTTVSVPLMTHTGEYKYLIDKNRKYTVVKLGLSKRAYMLLVLPDEGASLQDVESLLTPEQDIISTWHKHLKQGWVTDKEREIRNACGIVQEVLLLMGLYRK